MIQILSAKLIFSNLMMLPIFVRMNFHNEYWFAKKTDLHLSRYKFANVDIDKAFVDNHQGSKLFNLFGQFSF